VPVEETVVEVSTAQKLQSIMTERFTINNVLDEHRENFEQHVKGLIGGISADIEGYKDPDLQRDQSIKFTWGHNHDFGTFTVEGEMADRHIDILADFMDKFGLPFDLTGKKVLDVGVWTGGTALLFAALGAEVTALEEVVKYSDTVNYLASAFGLSNFECIPVSLYDLQIQDTFDYILYSGVIYHVSDPILSLRILFNALKDGGNIFVETYGIPSAGQNAPVTLYLGPQCFKSGSKDDLTRKGWNYFVPTPFALKLWIASVGFENIKVDNVGLLHRIKAVATRVRHKDILRAGLSKPSIR
ncbi:MAG: class I SAM-dependent methyltransferase, partial [Planctomycetota bacterium]|jgi:2-polyprenyl-3-methyl-5-hydroxy-6-metoxy-1,4-benzoquinol methylase